ncbi:hypothetical protein SLE2022_000330 [Rubroshorea leprosula]
MSILPSQVQRPASSSSQAPSQNPNPNHGSPPITFGSLNISDSSLHQPSSSSAAQDSGGSSKQVTQLEIPNGKRTSPQQNRQSKGKMSGPSRNHQGNGSHGSTPHSAGRRAQVMSANHLLNFHYDPIARSRPQPRPSPPRRQRKIKPYNKDLFLQANYKFVVLDTGNYSPESMDPDKMLQWEDIICVRYSTHFPVQCPICLEYPLCPQITSCGHIFCFPCILQYLLMDKLDQKDDCCKRCPLCFMIVSSKDLYTIYIENVRQCCVGDNIEFMLLTRQKDSFALFQKNKEVKDMHSCNNEMDDMVSKFTFTSDVNLSVRKAISDLDGWLARADSGLVDDLEKLPYVCAAMEQLEQRKKHWNEQQAYNSKQSRRNTDSKAQSTELEETANAWGDIHDARCLGRGKLAADDADAITVVTDLTIKKSNGRTAFDQNAVGESFEVQDALLSSSCDENKSLEGHSSSSNSGKDNDSYNFYQAVDGQHIILHPLNMKCLLHHYGTYDLLPQRVSGRVLELETVTQSEAMRRRYRYLSHFSLTTTFQLCEIDLSRVLPPDALLPFLDEIKKREKQRKQLARKEQKEKIKAEVAASASAVQFMPMVSNIGQSSCDNSPTFSMDDFEALGSSAVISTSPPVTGERKLFSSVTRLGFAAGHDSPALKIEEANADHKSEVAKDSAGCITGSRNSGSGMLSFATMISRAKSIENLGAAAKMNENENERGKKGKKASRVLLSTAGGRRY